VLTFTSSKLAESLDVVGRVRATVYVRSTVTHTHLVVRLCHVDRRGRSWNVCDGITSVHPAQVTADADGVRKVDVDLWPTGHRFESGHRIRVQIASAAFPRFARHPGTDEPVASATRLVASQHEVLSGPSYPSAAVLPVA
jgi:uncharacterized protein